MASFDFDYNVGEIILRKEENFWIFPTRYICSEKYACSPRFSYMGVKWCLVKLPLINGTLVFCLWAKGRSKLPKCNHIIQLRLRATCERQLFEKTGVIDPDYGCELRFQRTCCYISDSIPIYKHIFSKNRLVKLFFDIQKEQEINNATDINNDDNNLNEDQQSNDDEESNEEEESNDDEMNSDDEVTIKKSKLVEIKGIKRLAENLKQLLLDEKMSDAVLKVENREFKVHKAILTARSPVFASMFEHDLAEKNTNVVDIPDCTAESFEVFLNYLYSGKTESLSVSNVYNVYYAADKYHIDDLKEKCVIFMKKNLSVETFCDTISLSLRHRESKLQKSAVDFFCRNIKEIIKTIHWQNYMAANLTQANELLIKALE